MLPENPLPGRFHFFSLPGTSFDPGLLWSGWLSGKKLIDIFVTKTHHNSRHEVEIFLENRKSHDANPRDRDVTGVCDVTLVWSRSAGLGWEVLDLADESATGAHY